MSPALKTIQLSLNHKYLVSCMALLLHNFAGSASALE